MCDFERNDCIIEMDIGIEELHLNFFAVPVENIACCKQSMIYLSHLERDHCFL